MNLRPITLMTMTIALQACGGGSGNAPNDAGVLGGDHDGNVIAATCGSLAEGEGQCDGKNELRKCESGQLVAYSCPVGSACDTDTTVAAGVSCFCDGLADGICPDAVCTADPDCTAPVDAGPDCVPPSLPGPAQNALAAASGRLPQVGRIAVSGDTLYATVTYGGQSISKSEIIACPTSGCSATPTSFGHPDLVASDVGLATMGDKVFYTERDDTAPAENGGGDVLVSAASDGSARAVVYLLGGLGAATAVIAPTLAVDGQRLYFDTGRTGGSSTTESGLRRFDAGATSTSAISGTSHDPWAFTKVFAGGGRLAYWVDSVATPVSDRKLHIVDGTGAEVGASPAISSLDGAAMDATHLFYVSGGVSGCTLPACGTPVALGGRYQTRGFDVAISGNRVYFATVVDQGCGQGLTGALASCDVDEAIAGTCVPTYHATGLDWINLSHLVVTPTAAFATSKTAAGSILRVAL